MEAGPPSPLRPDLFREASRITDTMWPGVLAIPTMVMGATDGLYLRRAGIPTYGIQGIFIERFPRTRPRRTRRNQRLLRRLNVFIRISKVPLSEPIRGIHHHSDAPLRSRFGLHSLLLLVPSLLTEPRPQGSATIRPSATTRNIPLMLKTIPDILARIVEHKKAELVDRVGGIAIAAEDSVAHRRDFLEALTTNQPAVIAEVGKKHRPAPESCAKISIRSQSPRPTSARAPLQYPSSRTKSISKVVWPTWNPRVLPSPSRLCARISP